MVKSLKKGGFKNKPRENVDTEYFLNYYLDKHDKFQYEAMIGERVIDFNYEIPEEDGSRKNILFVILVLTTRKIFGKCIIRTFEDKNSTLVNNRLSKSLNWDVIFPSVGIGVGGSQRQVSSFNVQLLKG